MMHKMKLLIVESEKALQIASINQIHEAYLNCQRNYE
jgi:hypothetical protein